MRFLKHTVILAAAALVLGSCGLYREYEPPQMEFADSLYRRIDTGKDSVSIAEISWEDFFTDAILKDWIKLGLEHNTDLNVARH